MCEIKIQQKFITKNEQKQNEVIIKKVPKIGVEQIKGIEKQLFYL